MAWIESHQSLGRHPKLARLAACLKVPKTQAAGLLHFLWWWAIDYAPTGSLVKMTDVEIADGAAWEGDPGVFRAALRTCEFLDPDDALHDWDEYAGRLLSSRRQDAKRKRDVRRMSAGRPPPVHRTQPNPTDSTQPHPTDPTKTKPEAVVPDDLKASEPEIRDWLAFKKESGRAYKPKGLEALWRRLREIPADRRRAAVDHSMANNYQGLFEPKGGTHGQPKNGFRARGTSGSQAPDPAAVVL